MLERIEPAAQSSSTRPERSLTASRGSTDVLLARRADGRVVLRARRRAWSTIRSTRWPRRILEAATRGESPLRTPSEISEQPGQGWRRVDGEHVQITSRKKLAPSAGRGVLPPTGAGLECVVLLDGDTPPRSASGTSRARRAARSFAILARGTISTAMLVSGDREAEVRYLAGLVGIKEVHAGQTPGGKAGHRPRETAGPTRSSSATASTTPRDEGRHRRRRVRPEQRHHRGSRRRGGPGARWRRWTSSFTSAGACADIALQSAVGGMAAEHDRHARRRRRTLPPVAGAIAQEVIDVLGGPQRPPRHLTGKGSPRSGGVSLVELRRLI